jgi:hypothetical protein
MFAPRKALRKLIRDDSGQSLVVVVSSMTVLLGVAAFGIDAATWMAKHHQAQVVADSAALAAAQCLASPGHAETMILNGTQTSVPSCTSSSDSTDADQVAIDYAAANGLTITASNVTITGNTVKVRAPATSGGVFSKVAGISSTSQSAAAGASWTSTSGVCTNPGSTSGCDFMFAENSNCSSTSNGIDVTASGNSTVDGNIQSNGNLDVIASGNISLGSGGSYGPNGSYTCSSSNTYSGHNPWGTPPTQAPADIPFPIDYTKDFPACSGISCQSNGYPSFCTNAGTNITLTGSTNGDSVINDNIYCASGTGNPSTPSTWNGTITIDMSGKNVLYDTFVGGSISYTGSGNDTLSPCGYAVSGYTAGNCGSSVPTPVTTNYPEFYATGSSSNALAVTVSGGQTFSGDMFVPNGTADLTMSGNKTLTTFIEGNNISITMSGTMQGDGPTTNGVSAGSNGNVQLTS